jgi:two-component system chemotaxis sensor kinase CheA
MPENHLLTQFITEADELVDSLQVDLEELAAQHERGRINPNLVNRVFRSAHSLKGMAGMAGLSTIQEAAHRFEDLLDDLRMGRMRPQAAFLSGGMRVADGLGRMVTAAAQGRPTDEEGSRVVALVESLGTRSQVPAGVSEEEWIDLDPAVRRTLTEYEEHRLLENLRDHRPVYDLRVDFSLDGFDERFRALSDRLAALGEVISTLPGLGAEDPTRIAFRMIFATDEAAEQVADLLATCGGRSACITNYPAAESRRASSEIEQPAAVAEHPPVEHAEVAAAVVRVDMRELDDIIALTQRLALRTAELAATTFTLSERVGLGAREQFELKQQARSIERSFLEIEERLVELRLVPLSQSFQRTRRLVQKVAGDLGREATVTIAGEDVRLDKAIVDRIVEPLAHLLNNAIDHGIEPPEVRVAAGKPRVGTICVSAESDGNRVVITVSDDGAGIDLDAIRAAAARRQLEEEANPLDVIFQPGFTTAEAVSAISGRGVGLDAVAAAIADLGGEVTVQSQLGSGTTFRLRVPTTLVMISVFLVEVGGTPYAIDVNQLSELGIVERASVNGGGERRRVQWRDASLPIVELDSLVGGHASHRDARAQCLITSAGDRQAAIVVDRFVGEQEAIVKSLGRYGPRLRGVSGAIDLEGGRVALLLDLPTLLAEELHL